MITEWLDVMLDEVARRRQEAADAEAEAALREKELQQPQERDGERQGK